MATISNNSYSSPKNINLKGGILRFDVTKSSNPVSLDTSGCALYVDSSNQLTYWNKSGVTVLGSGGGGSTPTWETIFAADNTFTITPDATFTIAGNRSTATDVVTISNAAGGSGDCLQFANSGTGYDIRGTSNTWAVTKAGVITGTGLTFSAASTITTTAGDITWTLEDNDATALKIGSSGATSIMNFITTNGSEAVVFGNGMTLTDGLFTATSTSNVAPLFLLQNDTVTTFGADNAEDSGVFVFSSDSLTTGDLIRLQLDESALNGGAFIKAIQTDAGTAVFSVKENGEVEIAGVGGSDMLTVTAGDVVISDGSITLTDADNAASLTVTNNTATTASVVVLAGSGVFTGSTTSSWMTITPSGLTTGTGVYYPLAAMTTGKGLQIVANAVTTGEVLDISHTTSVIADGGSMVRISSTGIDTGGATNGVLLDLSSTASLAGVQVLGTFSALTTGTGVSIITSALTTGTALSLVNASGVMTGAGEMLNVSANAATTCTGIVRVSGTGLTDGFAMELTGGGVNATASGGVLNIAAGAATVGTALKVLTSGVYTGTTGVLSVSAASATTGVIANIIGTGLTTGTGLLISATEATIQTTGYYLRCYDGAANDFSISKYGAVVIAGSASGTASLTQTAGDHVLSSGNIVQTIGTLIQTPQAISNANTAISVTHGITTIANNAASTHTLADGVAGQRKTIVCITYTDDAVITPANLANGTAITLNAVGDACDLIFLGTEWWVVNLYGTAAIG